MKTTLKAFALFLVLATPLATIQGCQSIRESLGVETVLTPTQEWQSAVDTLAATNRALTLLVSNGTLKPKEVEEFKILKDVSKEALDEARTLLYIEEFREFDKKMLEFKKSHARLLTIRIRQ